jgi:2-oxoisovalerate dehydrogenase E1 component
MVKPIDVLPEFVPGEIPLGRIPKFAFSGRLRDELGRRLTPEQARTMLEEMFHIRAFEEMIVALKDGSFSPVPGFEFIGATHLSIGQEGVAVGAMSAIRADDYITSTHRGHGHSVAKGAYAVRAMTEEQLRRFLGDGQNLSGEALLEAALQMHLNRTLAELFGREDGYCRGRGGGMHIADFNAHHLGANAIVGGSMGIATGAGLAMYKLNKPQIVLCLVGDGAANNGICHETFNFATMAQFRHGLPVIFLIENNQYGMTGQQKGEVTGVDYLAQRGAGYNPAAMHAEVADGMNPLAVFDAVSRAAEKCRRGQGPVLLECMTYRYLGHSLSDARVKYRTPEEEAAWRARDPINTLSAQLVEAGVMTEAEVKELEAKVRAQIEAATRFAAASPEPDPATIYAGLLTDTSSENDPTLRASGPEGRMRGFRRDSEGRLMYRHAVAEALAEEMSRDERVVLYGEDVADYGGAFQVTHGLFEAFGRERVFNTAISEAAIAGTAAGAAMTGLRPVVELMYIDFVLLAMDQIGNQVAKTRYMFGGKAKLPLVIRTAVGGGKGYAGQHSQSLEAVVTQFPGLLVAAPSTAYDVKGLLKTSIRDDNPVIFIEHQLLYTEKEAVPEEEFTIPFGQGVIRREGTDVTLVAYSYMAFVANQVAEAMAAEGVSVEVVDPRTLVPLDIDLIAGSARKTGRVVLLSQAPKRGCYAEHIAHEIQLRAFDALKAPIEIVAAYDVPPPMAQTLERENIPGLPRISRAIHRLLDVPEKV